MKRRVLFLIMIFSSSAFAQYTVGVGGGMSCNCMGSSGSAVPLPIELITFEAIANENSVILKWSTASEINNDYFTVQRSQNGLDWENGCLLNGAGNSTELLDYECKDVNPYYGLSYYRLKQVDFDGKYSYSNIVSVKLSNSNPEKINIYPNPYNSGMLFFELGSNDQFLLTIYSYSGQIVYRKELIYPCIDLSDINSGIYNLCLENINTGLIQNLKLVIE